MARNYKRDRRGRFARVASLRSAGKKRAAVRKSNALRHARGVAAKEQAFWNKRLGSGAVKVTASTARVGILRKKTIPAIHVSPTSKANARKMQNWNAKQLKRFS